MHLIDCPNITKITSGISPVMFVKNAVLFPKCNIPLRIFEPRYRKMLDSVFKGSRSFILSFEDGYNGDLTNSVGTMGLVTSAVTQSDGSSIVMLNGLFKVKLNKMDNTNEMYQNWSYEKLESTNFDADNDLLDKLKITYNKLCNAIEGSDYPKNLPFSKDASQACDTIIEFLVSNISLKKQFFLSNNINNKISLTLKVIESVFQK